MPLQNLRRFAWSVGVLALGGALWFGQAALETQAQDASVEGPMFEVDPFWPKPLPNNWLLGMAIGLWVDDEDHIWMIHRGSSTLDNNEKTAELEPKVTQGCCTGAPPVLVFDKEGNLLDSWGGPGEGYDWPASNHGLHVDYKGNVWIGGNGADDAMVLKFTKDGKFLMQVGGSGTNAGSNDEENFGRVAKIWVDPETNEAYLADGYGNKRVAVIDADTGEMKRFWGAYGNKPDDTDLGPYDPAAEPAQQFRNPVHCVERAVDGLVYVCDRVNNRLQIFQPDGTFVKEAFYAKETLGAGSTWDIAFSPDPEQRFVYLADGMNRVVRILERESLEEISAFGGGGRQPGQFYGVHSIAVDSDGNVYTTETWEGKRIQKFVNKGIGQIEREQGTAWPRS